MSALDDLLKVVHDESFSQDMYDLGEQAAADLAALNARVEELEKHIEKLIGFSLACNEDDPWIFERNGGVEIVSNASAALKGAE